MRTCLAVLVLLALAAGLFVSLFPNTSGMQPVPGRAPPAESGENAAYFAESSGASNIGIVNDRWVDTSSLKNFAESSARLVGAETKQEKAIALFRFVQQTTFYSSGSPERAEPVYTRYMINPEKVLNVYTEHHCDGLSRLMTMTWRRLGERAAKFYHGGHTRAVLNYEDEDSVERWHFFDPSFAYFAMDRTGTRVATADEIALDQSLMTYPNDFPYQARSLPLFPTYSLERVLKFEEHSNHFSLRKNESVELLWSNINKPYWVPSDRTATTYDYQHGPYEKTYGNGIWKYAPNFSEAAYREGLEGLPDNVKSVAEDGVLPKLHPAQAGTTGRIVYHFEYPYIIADAWIDGSFRRSTASDLIRVSISNDGTSWKTVWEPSQTGDLALSGHSINEPFVVSNGYPSGLITPFGHYDYYLKVEMKAGTNISDAGINDLNITTVTQHNIFSLPMLWPVHNHITVSGDIATDVSLRLTYEWKDLGGDNRRNVVVAESLPYTYEILADATKWDEVVAVSGNAISKRLKVEAIPRLGGGNHVVEKEASPANTADITPLDSFPTERIIGTAGGPALKTAQQYILDIQDGLGANNSAGLQKVNAALVGLEVLRDQAAEQAIKDAIYNDKSYDYYTKVWGLQALYFTMGAESAPVMVEVLSEDPKIRGWTDVTGNRSDAGIRDVSILYAATILSNINNQAARDAAPLLAEKVNEWGDSSLNWGMIRATGKLGGPDEVPALTAKLGGTEASYWALLGLGDIGDSSALPAVLDFVIDEASGLGPESNNVQVVYGVEALGKIGNPDTAPHLYSFLDHWDEELRGRTAIALGRLGNPEAIPHLQALLGTEDFPWVRQAAEESIAALNSIQPCTNGQKMNCPKQQGVCSGSRQTCTNGIWPGCTAQDYLAHNAGYEAIETSNCSDGLDNDCDGSTDECGAEECVTMAVLMGYIGQWKTGNINMATLMQKITRWKTGQGC